MLKVRRQIYCPECGKRVEHVLTRKKNSYNIDGVQFNLKQRTYQCTHCESFNDLDTISKSNYEEAILTAETNSKAIFTKNVSSLVKDSIQTLSDLISIDNIDDEDIKDYIIENSIIKLHHSKIYNQFYNLSDDGTYVKNEKLLTIESLDRYKDYSDSKFYLRSKKDINSYKEFPLSILIYLIDHQLADYPFCIECGSELTIDDNGETNCLSCDAKFK